MCRSHPGGTGFGDMKGSWGAAAVLCVKAGVPVESPGEAVGEGAAWRAVDAPGLTGHGYKLRLGTIWQGQSSQESPGEAVAEEGTAGCRDRCFRDVSTVEQPPRTAAVVAWSRPELRRRAAVAALWSPGSPECGKSDFAP